jgi:eukaryotic-like serine/threonine-protein kinase
VVNRDGTDVTVTGRASVSLFLLMSPTPPFPEVALEPPGGRYEVVRPLGIGRTTTVFEAWDRDERRRVALKVPIRQFAADEAFLTRLQREVEAVVGFDHPNVAAVHGFGWDGPAGFVVVELVEGSTLWDLLATRGPLPPAGAARVALQVCAALDAAHARGLNHGHLTLANVLLRIDGRVKLTDFRLAQAARPLAAAPDPEGDLRALGRCMVATLTGAEPAPGERVRLGPGVPAELAAIVVRAAGDHQNGYRSAGDLGRDLGRFLATVRRGEAPVSLPGAAAAHDPPDGAAADSHQAIEPKRSLPGSAQGEPPAAGEAGSAPARRRLGLGVVAVAGACLAVVVAVVAFAGLGRDPGGQADGRTVAGPALARLPPATSQPPLGSGEPAATTAPQTTAPPEATLAPAPTTTIGGGAGGSGQRVVVPNVVGRDREQAVAALTKARLGVRVVLVQVRGAGRADRVVSQEPPAGQAVPHGSVVTLTVGAKRLPG